MSVQSLVVTEWVAIMFMLFSNLHLTGPLAILVPIAMIGLRLVLRRSRGSRR